MNEPMDKMSSHPLFSYLLLAPCSASILHRPMMRELIVASGGLLAHFLLLSPELQIQMPSAYMKKLSQKGIMSVDSGSRIFVHGIIWGKGCNFFCASSSLK